MKKLFQLQRNTFRLMLMLLAVAALYAATPKAARAQDDPPGRVARLNFIQGSVSFQPAGSQDWLAADPNRPMTTGDNLWADVDSRGELHIGSTSIRLASETGISFLNLDDRTIQIQLAQGTIEVHLRRLDAGGAFEIDTPNLAFTLTRGGEYRISADPDGTATTIIVREGEGEATGGAESWDLRAGHRYTFRGTDQVTYDSDAAPGFDDFGSWSQERDQRENGSQSARYVSRDVDGYYDLDDYGNWQNDPDYGAIWYPSGVVVGWMPYHYGHFVWINPWGWTWVGEEPWGFAPYHYGRWALVGGNWGWVPGPIVVRPMYAPALVGFVGGGGLSVAVGFGGGFTGVAWFPLGPRDVWIPAYRASPRYVQNVNITNTRIVNVTQVTTLYNNVYVNRSVGAAQVNYMYANRPEAITAVRREDFVSARPVAQAAVKVTPEQIRIARPVENAAVAPTRASYVAANAKIATAKPPAAFTQKPVVTKINPPMPASRGRVYTNDSEQFREGAAKIQENAARSGNNAAPADDANTNAPAGRSGTATQNESQTQAHPSVKFTPPTKAKDEMYDVHPPLNRKPEPPPKEEDHTEQPAPKEQPHSAPKSEPASKPPKP